MSSNDDFILPEDASDTLRIDVATQMAIGHAIEKVEEAEARAHRRSDENTENERNCDDFVFPEDASDTLRLAVATQMAIGAIGHVIEKEGARAQRRSNESTANESLVRIQNAIRLSNQVDECQKEELVSAIEQLVTCYKKEDPKTLAAQEVIASIIESNVDNALASILYSQLEEGLRYYKTSKNFGGNLNNVIRSILDFFDVFTQKFLEISRHTVDTCLVDAVKFILTKFKVHHFQNTLNEKIHNFLYLALKLSCQLLMHEDETIILCIKEKRLIDILRLYVSSPDPQFQLLALMATGFLGDVGNSDRFFINPLAMKVLMESVRDNDGQIPIETMVQALEKLMQFEDNVEMLIELDFVSSLRTMLETDDVAVVLAGLRLLSCLSNDDSIAPLVHDQLIHVLRSRCLSFPNPEVKTATSRLIDLLDEKSGIAATAFDHGEQRPQTSNDIINNGRHIMISHSYEDRRKAKKIGDHLQGQHFEVWMDSSSPENYSHDQVASAVEEASMFIYCASESYKRSEDTKREFLRAVELKKTRIAVKLDECTHDGWLGLNMAGTFIHSMQEISDEALDLLSEEISRIRATAQNAEIQRH